MTHDDAAALIAAIHKIKTFRPTEWERGFLENLSFYVSIASIKVSEKQSKTLQTIYRKAQGG